MLPESNEFPIIQIEIAKNKNFLTRELEIR